jgi:PST family polysaccharide transporter
LVASGIVLLCVAIANVLIGRLLGVEGQGRVAAATLLPMIIAYGGELGIPVATGYLVNRDPSRRNETIASARYISALLTLVLTVGAAIVIWALPIPGQSKSLSLLFCLFIGLNLFHRMHLMVLQAELQMGAFNAIRVAGAATYLSILLVLAMLGAASALSVIMALLIANVVWCFLSAWRAASRPVWIRDKERARALFRFGLPAHFGNVSSVDGLKLDQLVLALFLSTRQLGLYVAAMTIIIGNRVIGNSVGMMCFPLASRGDGVGGIGVQRHLQRLVLLTLGMALAVATFEIVFSRKLLTALFGGQFGAAAPALQILAVGSVFTNVRQACAEWLRGSGRPGIVAVSEAAGVASLLILYICLWNGTIVRVAWIVTISAVVSFALLPRSVIATFRNPSEHTAGRSAE